MNRLFQGLLVLSILVVLVFSGCDLLTKDSPRAVTFGSGSPLLINEVFTIAPDKYYAYSWIEFYNPSDSVLHWFTQTFPAAGYAVGSGGAILKTSNDGDPWFDSLANAAYGTITSINFPNPDTGFFCTAEGKVFKLNANGVTDLSAGLPAGHDYSKLHFASIAGIHSYVSPSQVDRRIQALYLVADSGLIFRSFNQGSSWTQVLPTRTTPLKKNLKNIYTDFESKNFFVVGDSGAFFQSTNAGTNWFSKVIPEPYRGTTFNCSWFVDTLGVAVGDNGSILISTNGGSLWLPETSGVTSNLRGLFLSPNRSSGPNFTIPFEEPGITGWIVGDHGTILRTYDKGQTWIRVAPPEKESNARLNSVYFVDSKRGWIFGDGGVILTTADGGVSWGDKQTVTNGPNFLAAHFMPLTSVEEHGFYISMVAQRSYIYYDPITNTINPDFITRKDTGVVLWQPQTDIEVKAKGFVVLTNDSVNFDNHTQLGPGSTSRINFPFGVDTAGVGRPGYNPFAHLLKWNILPSSEIRLVKFSFQSIRGVPPEITYTVISVVRFGNYRPSPDDYQLNQPLGNVPEWWSIARFNNDLGENPADESTASSFYLCDKPIPGWYSQRAR
jgi:photosystem II stability/assembly factor-like uncharacterized protein